MTGIVDSSYMIMSSALWNLENFKCLIFVVESVHCMNLYIYNGSGY